MIGKPSLVSFLILFDTKIKNHFSFGQKRFKLFCAVDDAR